MISRRGRAGEAREDAVALGVGRLRRERERARLRDREAPWARPLPLRAVAAVRRAGAAARRVDQLQQDQGGQLRPHAHAPAVAAAALRPVLDARVAAVAAAAEHAGGGCDGLHDELDRAAVATVGAARLPEPPAPPSERRRPPSVSGPCVASEASARPRHPALPLPPARAGGVDGSADDQSRSATRALTLPPGALRFSPSAAIEPVVTRSPVIADGSAGSAAAERPAAAAVRGHGADCRAAGGLDRHGPAGSRRCR